MITGGSVFLAMGAAGWFTLPLQFNEGPPAALPPLARYEPPTFPAALRHGAVSDGFATVAFTVNGDGRVQDALALEATHPALADAVYDALRRWILIPAESDTVPRRELIQFDFRRTAAVRTVTHREIGKEAFPATRQERLPIRTVARQDLEQPPTRLQGSLPKITSVGLNAPTGRAVIQYVIDREGAVRLPVVVESSDPQFGLAILAAVRTWRFEPTIVANQAVNVEVTQSFSYGAR